MLSAKRVERFTTKASFGCFGEGFGHSQDSLRGALLAARVVMSSAFESRKSTH